MRLHRFFIHSPLAGKQFDVADADLVHQWKRVFRYNVGSQVIVFDGSGVDAYCVITRLGSAGATLEVLDKKEIPPPKKSIYLCFSLLKKDNVEWVVQKAVELGVTHLVPLITERSEKKNVRTDRLEKIVTEALEQSGRADTVTLHPVTHLTDLFTGGLLPQEKILFHFDGIPVRTYLDSTHEVSYALFVGPEGGFSEEDIAFLKQYNVTSVSLGNTVLRAETASIAGASLFLLQ